jgi:hypothetical protein
MSRPRSQNILGTKTAFGDLERMGQQISGSAQNITAIDVW